MCEGRQLKRPAKSKSWPALGNVTGLSPQHSKRCHDDRRSGIKPDRPRKQTGDPWPNKEAKVWHPCFQGILISSNEYSTPCSQLWLKESWKASFQVCSSLCVSVSLSLSSSQALTSEECTFVLINFPARGVHPLCGVCPWIFSLDDSKSPWWHPGDGLVWELRAQSLPSSPSSKRSTAS